MTDHTAHISRLDPLPDTLATREVFYELVARNAIEAKQREKK